MFNIFRVDVIQCGLQFVKRTKYDEEKGENVKLRKTMSWLLWSLLLLLLPMLATAQQRVFLKPEEPGEVNLWPTYSFSNPFFSANTHKDFNFRQSYKEGQMEKSYPIWRMSLKIDHTLQTKVEGGLVCTSLPGLEPGLSENLYFACTCGVQGTRATFSLARY